MSILIEDTSTDTISTGPGLNAVIKAALDARQLASKGPKNVKATDQKPNRRVFVTNPGKYRGTVPAGIIGDQNPTAGTGVAGITSTTAPARLYEP
jgi:beta-lactam-binding protein with PASTA domain